VSGLAYSGGWVDTGVVAGAIGASVVEAAARLRTAEAGAVCTPPQARVWHTVEATVARTAADSQLSLQSPLPDRLPGFAEGLGRHVEGSA
jgi:hypothetical protein